jgi:hypothetical protein
MEQTFGFEFRAQRGKKERDKPQVQGPFTCHFFVCKVFWDRGGGHSQPMVLLGILKGTRERSGDREKWTGNSQIHAL